MTAPVEQELLIFEVGTERCAIAAATVRELARAVTIVPLPHAPPIVEGVIDVRGELVPVIDVRRRFRQAARPVDPGDHLILAWAGKRLVAIRADRATALVRAAVVVTDEHLPGVARLPDGLAVIHDLATFLSAAEAEALDEALA